MFITALFGSVLLVCLLVPHNNYEHDSRLLSSVVVLYETKLIS